MSHIPNSAMPHAQAEPQNGGTNEASQSTWSRGMETVTDTIREYPKTAMAAGAAVVAGAVAAAAIPMMRGRGESTSGKGAKKGNGKSSKA